MKYFIANWKANKTKEEADRWVDTFLTGIQSNSILKNALLEDSLRIILCPPFPLLYPISAKISGYKNIYLGSQDVSVFDKGSLTGEVPADLLKGVIQYVIIGHSERRNLLHETDAMLSKKVEKAKSVGIEPIFCVRGEQDMIPPGVRMVAYEPVWAIGTGKNDSLDEVLTTKQKLQSSPTTVFLYGGSVNEDNAKIYLSSEQIDGLLVGTASLDPDHFLRITTK